MDTGILNLQWCNGYSGSPLFFVDLGVLCYQCGRNLKTISIDGKHSSFAFRGTSVGPIAVHKINKHIAFGEYAENPKIFVLAYPGYTDVAVLEGGADLLFQEIVFSEGRHMLSVSGVPNFNIVLWDYLAGTKLASVPISPEPLKSISFNKINWRQICVMSGNSITLWNIEQCGNKYLITPWKVTLPALNCTEVHSDTLTINHVERASTKSSKFNLTVPDSSVAGLIGEEVQRLETLKDTTAKVKPRSMTWLPTGDFYVGCEGGEIFKVESDLCSTKLIYSPPPMKEKIDGLSEEIFESQDDDLGLKPGSLDCLAFHSIGLYAAGKDGVIRLFDVSKDELSLIEEIKVNYPVTTLTFSTNYSSLAWGSPEGIIQAYTCGDKDSVVTLLDISYGNIVAVGGLSIGSECCVSLRENGHFQIWKLTDGICVGQIHLREAGSVLACSPIAHYAAVGTTQGVICFLDASKPQTPRIVMRHRLFRQAVNYLTFNGDEGRILFAASRDSNIFLIDGRPSSGFAILGSLTVTGTILALSANHYGKDKSVLVAACNNKPEIKGANILHKYTFTSTVLDEIQRHYRSSMCDIDDQACSALKMGLRHAVCGLAIGDGELLYALSASNKKILTFTMPVQESDKPLKKSDLLLNPTGEYPGHQLSGGNVLISPHLKWLLSYSSDGAVKLRNVSAMERTAIFTPHEYQLGGIKSVAISDDCQYILSCGFDGTIACYHWNHLKGKGVTSVYKQRRNRDMDLLFRENPKLSEFSEISNPVTDMRRASELERERRELIELAKQKAQDNDEIYVSPPPSPRLNATWLEQRQIDSLSQENKHFASIKYDLRSQIRDIRRTIQQMMAENRDLPEIEKLGRHEFDLDLEEQARLQQEGEAEVQKVRENIELENLAKLYIRDKIKEECWDKMSVKGRALQAFNSALEVSNFPLRERTVDQLNLIKTVSVRRSIEKREAEARKKLAEFNSKSAIHEEEEGDDDESSKEHPSITGSLGAQYGGGNPLFYSQFELHSREQKIYQIILLEDAIHRIKENFNKEFDDVFSKKEQEIAKVKEKNKRISKIIKDLGLDESIVEPHMSIAEKPELLLEVADVEIKVEKYLTPEQRKKLEEEKLLEEERLAKERGDNARERALEMMMGGVLEIKKEDELKKDVPKPAFMLTKKEEEYTEDEVKAYKEYLKKVQDLNEEREKFRKQLEAELRKLQAAIQEGLQAFDEVLNVLFMRKIKVMMVIYQEELKILRLRFSMLIHEEITIRDNDLHETLELKRHAKQQAFEGLAEARKILDIFRNEYEHLQAEDKYLDKSFRREFTDALGVHVDTLYKQFKRRPRTQKFKSIDGVKRISNPFSDRPSSSIQLNHLRTQLTSGLDDLDKPHNMPDGIDHHAWEKMCKLRRNKVESELQLKLKANTLAEIQTYVHRRQEEDDKYKAEIEQLTQMIAKIKEDEQRFILNLEVQLLLKQGQIEVEAGPFIRDFRGSVLVHRNVVEDLNTTIKQLGERKIASMVESKDFRKGIIQLEWEHKKMSMQMEDLENKLKDIQFIKVTREIQAYLHEEDYEAKKAEEISTLEQTVSQLKKFHEKTLAQKKQFLRDMAKSTKNKALNNKKLDEELLDLNVVVNERKQIEDINIENRDDDSMNRRYQEIVQRRKMVDLAKAQAQEVAILRAEVERLRMHTFPALVQVER
ncbi:cilia- and flagella-associated protein 43 [Biomphalaria pfeifferi]|uniref:Cilia- and flagella-associated protein 43 n=1 Tax=Biomphalaria pfeifferi TaxID=112525 RepID=A0AAD8FPS7_BIOPF|nr:cilia- and flagella-associated protein 43 [Biomphalaria pfeifferi]